MLMNIFSFSAQYLSKSVSSIMLSLMGNSPQKEVTINGVKDQENILLLVLQGLVTFGNVASYGIPADRATLPCSLQY